jgi:hypothetical protein
MENQFDLLKYKEENENQWLANDDNIFAVAIGHKFEKGLETKEYEIYAFTSSKTKTLKSLKGLYDPEKVVFEEKEKPVMFCAAENSAGTDPNMYRPLAGGAQISYIKQIDPQRIAIYIGTLGMFVKRKGYLDKTYILTNWHVLGEATDNDFYQPIYSGQDSDKILVAKGVAGGYTECGDVGLAEMKSGFSTKNTDILEIGKIKGICTDAIEVGQLVQKRGRTTGLTHGVVKYIEVTLEVNDVIYKHQAVVEGAEGTPKFADHGDSGSIVLTFDSEIEANNNAILGLLWGGNSSSGEGIYSTASYIFDQYGLELFTR